MTIIEKTSSDTEKKPEVEDDYSDNNEASNSAEDATTAADVSSQTVTGDNSNPLLWSILSVIALAGVTVIGVVYRKRFKGILSLLLVCVLLAGMVPNALNVHAEGTATSNTKTLTATENVTVGENTVSIGFELTYTLPEEEPSAPVITIGTQPTAAEVKVGEKATLTVAATATENAAVTYQWYSCEDANKTNAAAVSGTTSATYEVTPAAVGTVYYYCVVSAVGATSVTSDVVAVAAPALFSENFDSESFGLENWSTTYGICQGGASASVQVADQKLQISRSTSEGATNIDARWGGETVASAYADKKVIYEFALKLTADTGTNVIAALRSNASESSTTNTPSYLFEISNNGLYVRDSSNNNEGIASLSAGEYKIKVEVDLKSKIRDIYVDGTTDEGEPVSYAKTELGMHKAAEFKAEYMNSLLRFIISSGKTTASFSIDDILIYEAALSEDTE